SSAPARTPIFSGSRAGRRHAYLSACNHPPPAVPTALDDESGPAGSYRRGCGEVEGCRRAAGPGPEGTRSPHSAEVTGGPQERSPGASAPGPLFPFGRFLPRFFAQFAQVLHHFFGRDAWPWIVGRR